MKKFLLNPGIALMIFMTLECDNNIHPGNPVLGKWKSTWSRNENKSIGLTVSFESNNTFHVTAFGTGQTEPQSISGIYGINRDTIMILDKIEEPKQLCDYADTGKYTFMKHKDTLLFRVIKDDCERRKLTLEMGLFEAR